MLKASPAANPRSVMIDVLRRWERGRVFAPDLLAGSFERFPLSRRDRALVTATVDGVIRNRGAVDWLIDCFSRGRHPPSGSLVRQLLRVSLFHLLWMKKIPAYAALHQAGELAKELLSPPETAYVNALLRAVLVNSERLPWPDRRDPGRYLSVVYSHPEWMVSRWLRRWDVSVVEELCRVNNEPPPIFIRVNLLKTDPDRARSEIENEGVSLQPVSGFTNLFRIAHSGALRDLAAFQKGYFQVQDISSLRVVEALDPRPEETVIDFCAAPGGKASDIAERMKERGTLIAADASEERLRLLRQNFSRLGIVRARIEPLDLLIPPKGVPAAAADRILLDVPCSNTGVLRRRVDVRWRLKGGDLRRLARRQCEILHRAAAFLKPGGRLVYSTCSLEPEENQEVVKEFLRRHRPYLLVRSEERLPERDGGDGYYLAVLTKK